MTKRTVYISLFVLLGIIVSFLVHVAIEIPVIYYLIGDFDERNLGLSWDQWFLIHHIFTVALFAAGVYVGWRQGRRWWHALYVKKKRPAR